MQMTMTQQIITIAIIAGVTLLTRFVAFLVFPQGKPTPAYIQYLGQALPLAALGMLVVYCYRNVSFTGPAYGLPELVSGAVVVALHLWKRNLFLSIIGGTALYLVWVNVLL